MISQYTLTNLLLSLLLSNKVFATPSLYKRADDDDNDDNNTFLTGSDDPNSSTWQWGRWILFILFIVGFFAVFIFTVTTNRRRRYNGQAPIRGTAWMTPPSYRQSEQQYHGNTQRVVEDYVPEYTEEANINDLGYYDERGDFHANGKSEYLPPPPLVQEVDSNDSLNLSRPQRAVVHDNDEDADFNFSRPSYTAQQYYNMSSTTPVSPFLDPRANNDMNTTTGTSSSSTDNVESTVNVSTKQKK